LSEGRCKLRELQYLNSALYQNSLDGRQYDERTLIFCASMQQRVRKDPQRTQHLRVCLSSLPIARFLITSVDLLVTTTPSDDFDGPATATFVVEVFAQDATAEGAGALFLPDVSPICVDTSPSPVSRCGGRCLHIM